MSRIKSLLVISSLFLAACGGDSAIDDAGSGSGSGSNDGGSTELSVEERFNLEHFAIPANVGIVHFEESTIPASGSGSIGDVECNSYAIAGGSTYLSLSSDTKYDSFIVWSDGTDYYYEVTPKGDDFEFMLGQNVEYGETLKIMGVDKSGEYSAPYNFTPQLQDVEKGALQIALSFDEDKDLDLSLLLPSGKEIYFGEVVADDVTSELLYGNDLTSNDDCVIDHIRNENIFVSKSALEKGKYRVRVNMYGNCTRLDDAKYTVRATAAGELVKVNSGKNPYFGAIEVGAEANRDPAKYIEVMSFVID